MFPKTGGLGSREHDYSFPSASAPYLSYEIKSSKVSPDENFSKFDYKNWRFHLK